MSNLSKILVTIGIVFLFLIVFGAIVGTMSDAGHSTPLIIVGALFGALRAIWKKSKSEDGKDNNTSALQK